MKEQLELLWELQRIDLDLKSIREEQEGYPKEMKRFDEKERIEKERIQKERERVDSLEKERRRREGSLNSEQEKVKRTEGKMFEVKTNKEYQALLNEIETLKGASGREEEEILRLLEEIDDVRKDLSKREKEIGITLGKIEEEKRRLQEKMSRDQAILKKQVERREALCRQLDPNLFKLYKTLAEKRQGVGVVGVRHEVCQGCFVNVPPQMFIEVQKTNALIRCPNCNRILFWEANGQTK